MVDAANRGWRDNSGVFTKQIVEDRILPALNAKLGSHPKDKSLRDGVSDDYEDLQIAVGGGVAIGKNSIGLGNATDARTLQASEVQDTCIDDLTYDLEEFEQNNSPLTGSPEVF
ncbi:hypothetical protein ACET3Z_017978 [Daucus carota]